MVKAQRMTRQKKVIVDILRNTKTHPTADWIYEQARKEIPGLSLGTVYRNLNILKEAGEILELNYGSTYSHYDGNPVNHYHFHCNVCGNIYDIDLPKECKIVTDNCNIEGHQVNSHRLELYGTCRQCRQ